MDVSILPASRCISYASYNRSIGDPQFIHWLGFDRYKKILYGIRSTFGKNPVETEIVMRSIYITQVKVIETIKFAKQKKGKKKEEVSGLSRCGGYVAIIQYISKYRHTTAGSTFHLYSTEDGLTVKYRLIMPIQKTDRPSLLHSSFVGWLLAIPRLGKGTEVRRFIFNEDKKRLKRTELLTKTPSYEPLFIFNYKLPVICGTNLISGSPEDDTLHVFDFHTKSWSTRVVEPTEVNNNKGTNVIRGFLKPAYYLVGSEDDESLFGVPGYWIGNILDKKQNPIIFKLVDNIWKPLFSLDRDITFFGYDPPYPSHWDKIPVFVSSDTLVVNLSRRSSSTVFILNISANILSLQNLAAKEFLMSPHLFGKEASVLFDNLPTLMRHQYFGPMHSWKK